VLSSPALLYWNVLDKSVLNYQNKIYKRGRGGGFGLQKQYAITFTIPSDNAESVRDILIPSLEKAGFKLEIESTGQEAINNLNLGNEYTISPQNKHYLNLNLEKQVQKLVPPKINILISYNHLYGNNTNELVKPGTTEGFIILYPND